MPVGGEGTAWLAELPVEVDGGVEGKDAGGDSAEEAGWGLREVVFESELVFERVDDRLDPLSDLPDRWTLPLQLVGSVGAQQQGTELGDCRLEVAAGEAFVCDHELAGGRLPFEQLEHGIALGHVGGDKVEVADAAVGAAPENEPHPPVEAGVGGAVAKGAPGRQLGVIDGADALPAGQRRRVDEAELVVEAGQLGSDRPPERDQLRRQLPAALVVARLARQPGEQTAEPPLGSCEEAAVARLAEQHLRDHQADQLVIADLLWPTAPRPRISRKQRTSSAIDCDQEGVEVGAHVGLQADGVFATPTFDTLALAPYTAITAPAVNYRSSI
jgi:hypothetical protein